MDDEFETSFPIDPPCFKPSKQLFPGGFQFILSQFPVQDFPATALAPDPQCNQNRDFSLGLHLTLTSPAVWSRLTCWLQQGHPDGIQEQDRRDRAQFALDMLLDRVQTLIECSQTHRTTY